MPGWYEDAQSLDPWQSIAGSGAGEDPFLAALEKNDPSGKTYGGWARDIYPGGKDEPPPIVPSWLSGIQGGDAGGGGVGATPGPSELPSKALSQPPWLAGVRQGQDQPFDDQHWLRTQEMAQKTMGPSTPEDKAPGREVQPGWLAGIQGGGDQPSPVGAWPDMAQKILAASTQTPGMDVPMPPPRPPGLGAPPPQPAANAGRSGDFAVPVRPPQPQQPPYGPASVAGPPPGVPGQVGAMPPPMPQQGARPMPQGGPGFAANPVAGFLRQILGANTASGKAGLGAGLTAAAANSDKAPLAAAMAGAGGSLTGQSNKEDKLEQQAQGYARLALQQQAQGDLAGARRSNAIANMIKAQAYQNRQAQGQNGGRQGSNAWQMTEIGRIHNAENQINKDKVLIERRRMAERAAVTQQGPAGVKAREEIDKRYDQMIKDSRDYYNQRYKLNDKLGTRDSPHQPTTSADFEALQRLKLQRDQFAAEHGQQPADIYYALPKDVEHEGKTYKKGHLFKVKPYQEPGKQQPPEAPPANTPIPGTGTYASTGLEDGAGSGDATEEE